jgi:hypothetical protein
MRKSSIPADGGFQAQVYIREAFGTPIQKSSALKIEAVCSHKTLAHTFKTLHEATT